MVRLFTGFSVLLATAGRLRWTARAITQPADLAWAPNGFFAHGAD